MIDNYQFSQSGIVEIMKKLEDFYVGRFCRLLYLVILFLVLTSGKYSLKVLED